nr:MAG TPA: hypothetical protein [Caudoviricetes sp.]
MVGYNWTKLHRGADSQFRRVCFLFFHLNRGRISGNSYTGDKQ